MRDSAITHHELPMLPSVTPLKRLRENPNREVGDASVQPTRSAAESRESPNRQVGDPSLQPAPRESPTCRLCDLPRHRPFDV